MRAQKIPRQASDLVYAPEDDNTADKVVNDTPWKILIVDDEPDIHAVTQMSLKSFEFGGRGLEFLNAYSAKQAKAILLEEDDIAVALVDVVMETEHAGRKSVV